MLDEHGAMSTDSSTCMAIQNGESVKDRRFENVRQKDPELRLALYRAIAEDRDALTQKTPTLKLRIDEWTAAQPLVNIYRAASATKAWSMIVLGIGAESKRALRV